MENMILSKESFSIGLLFNQDYSLLDNNCYKRFLKLKGLVVTKNKIMEVEEPRLIEFNINATVCSATEFVGTTATGIAIAETLAISDRTEQRCIELLEKSQRWAMEQIDDLLRATATSNPRILADILLSLSSEVETLADTHAILRARYQADIDTISEHL